MLILAVDNERPALNALLDELKIVFPTAELHDETDGDSAAAWAESLAETGQTLDYAFLDINLCGMNGLELARRIKSVHPGTALFFCTGYSEYAIDAYGMCAKGYLLKPITASRIEQVLDEMMVGWREAVNPLPRDIRIHTFGNFEVFVDGVPLSFEREKSRELLAYLVDRHGASATTEQLAAVLWEDENYDRKLKNRTTAAISSLLGTLRAAGAGDIIVKSWGRMAIDPTKFRCDAYDFEKWDVSAVNAFHGEYMAGYSWAEFTTGKYVSMERAHGG